MIIMTNPEVNSYVATIDDAFTASKDLKRFDDRDVQVVSDKVVEIRRRRFSGFIYWLDHPDKNEKDVVDFIISIFGVSKASAYRDLQVVKSQVGNIKGTDKQFIRVELYENVKRVIKIAETAENFKQVFAGWGVIGKFCNLDKEEPEEMPWGEIIPPDFEPSSDVSILGLKPIKNVEKLKEKLKNKYLKDVVDVDFIDLDKDGED